MPEMEFAVERAIQRAQQSVTEAYLRAEIAGPALLAAASAEGDEFGYFSAAGADQLVELGILEQREGADGPRYRFVNALLPPYVVMRSASAA